VGQRPRDQVCLIVAAFAEAVGMQRNGHYNVRPEFGRLSSEDFGQSGSEPIAEPGDLFVL
jgi:hypothetical protein